MATRVGINGFGRIGRQTYKIILECYPEELELVAVNDITDISTLAHLLRYDSIYGAFDGEIEVTDTGLLVEGEEVRVFSEWDPSRLPWGDLGVEIVIEATGLFRRGHEARRHIQSGARKVIITAPAIEEDITIILGVNEDRYDPENHHIVSNASCTTNCAAPVIKVLHKNFGVVQGQITAMQPYTAEQRLVDAPHKDLRRARHAAVNIVPTTTGAAKALGIVMPELAGKFDGTVLRVPTSVVSINNLVVELERETTVDGISHAFRQAAEKELEGILLVTDEPLVSSDFIGAPFSAIVDAPLTSVVGGTMARVMAWFDNEWGYSARVADLARLITESL